MTSLPLSLRLYMINRLELDEEWLGHYADEAII